MIVIAIRKEVFESLPESVRKLMLELAEEEATTGIMRAYYDCPKAAAVYDFKAGLYPKEGVEMISLSSADRSRLKAAEATVRNMWINEMSGKGFEAEKIYNTFAELCAQWDKKTPKEFMGK
jgi:TRAP-type C4-dicarboxylate transport system substrate-binding protein